MKKHLIATAVILFLFAAPHAFAQFVPLVPGGIPGLTDLQPAQEDTLVTFFNNLYKYLIGVAAALAVIMIIWGGLLYSTTDSVGNKEQGKEKIRMALFGLVLVLAPVLVFSVINPSILNLSIGLKPINLSVTSSRPGSGPGPESRLCSGQITTNCSPLPPSSGGRVPIRVPGWWCYERVDNNFWCADTYAACFNDLTTPGTPGGADPKPGATCTQTPGAPLSPPVSTPTECTLSGSSGLLQIASCPSAAAAIAWADATEICNSGARATQTISNPTNGLQTVVMTCSGKQNYVFIDSSQSSATAVNIPNNIRPLARTNENPNNGSQAIQFASICKSANFGLKTCVSDTPRLSSSVPCNLTGPNAATTWKCYNEKLTCTDASSLNPKCSSNPAWVPFE